MLILTRKNAEKVIIDDCIEVHVIRSANGCVKLGFKAPSNVKIYREEIYTKQLSCSQKIDFVGAQQPAPNGLVR
ncbi:MAG: carbon storage regulator [Gammaproteobacteria bacterium]|jgi:carbon storage regulator